MYWLISGWQKSQVIFVGGSLSSVPIPAHGGYPSCILAPNLVAKESKQNGNKAVSLHRERPLMCRLENSTSSSVLMVL